MTDGITARSSKVKEHYQRTCDALNSIEVYDINFLGFPDQRLDQIPLLEIVKRIQKITDKFQPHTIFTHWRNDVNKDHQIAFDASLVVARPLSSVKFVFSYYVPSSVEWFPNNMFQPNYFISLTDEIMRAKINAFKKYNTEIKKSPHPRSPNAMRAASRYWGQMCGCDFAEPFVLLRGVV